MVRGKIWFRCAVVHDPVCPKIVNPALIGWEAKYRKIDLLIERVRRYQAENQEKIKVADIDLPEGERILAPNEP